MHLVCVESNVVETRVEVFLMKQLIEIDAPFAVAFKIKSLGVSDTERGNHRQARRSR